MTDPGDLACAAWVLDERTPGDPAEIDKLRSDPRVSVRDLLAEQRSELGSLLGVRDEDPAEAPRWVYYPWRNSLVRMLGPGDYHRLRLDRNRNKITPAEQDFYAGLTVGVVGASVGHLIALGLALEGLFGTLRITDFDSVELSNLNRLPGSVLDYGLNKTTVIARRIAEIDPYLVVEPAIDGIDIAGTAAFVAGLDVLIEVCDSLDVKLALREQAARVGLPVIMVTSDRGTVDVERFDLDPSRKPFHGLVDGLTSAVLTGMPAAAKVPYMMKIVGADGVSARMAASMLEIGESLTTWPHLAGDAMAAAACAVMAVRRLGQRVRGHEVGLPSGRLHTDLVSTLDDLSDPVAPVGLPPFTSFGDYRNLPEPTGHVEAVIRAGQLAPSGGNVQPWRIARSSVHEDVIGIELDTEQTTAMDVEFRGSRVAMGAALLNMRIAAAARGLLGDVEFRADSSVLLRLSVGSDARLAELFRPMLGRVTNRNLGDPEKSIPEADLASLTVAAEAEGGGIGVIATADGLAAVADILADADRIRFLLPELHREMIGELRDPRTEPLERGLDIRSLEMGAAVGMLDIARRGDVVAELGDWDAAAAGSIGDSAHAYGRGLGNRVRALVQSSAAIVAVTVSGGAAVDYVRGGAAMQRLWIAATAAGLAVQPVVPLFLYAREDEELRAIAGRYFDRLRASRQRLRDLFDIAPDRNFAMVLRVGYAAAPTAISLRSGATVTHSARDGSKQGEQ